MKTTTVGHLRQRLLAGLLICISCVAGPLAQAQLVAAVLPSSRSTEVGSTVTVFATIINGGTDIASGCGIEPPAGLTGLFSFQTTDPTTNLPVGGVNELVDLAPGAAQSFVLSLTPMAAINALDAAFSFSCTSGATADAISGINTLLLSASDTPVADIIALAGTVQNTGVLDINNSAGAFSLATINLGSQDTLTVSADTGDAVLPIALSLCETFPDTGACMAAPAASVEVTVASGAAPTFSVFSSTSERITNNPAINRVFVRFTDSGGVVRGGTSVGIENEFDLAPNLTESVFGALESTFSNFDAPGQNNVETFSACGTGQVTSSGTLEGNGTATTTFMLTTRFEDCDGVNGELNTITVIDFGATNVSFDQTQNGNFSTPECEQVQITNFQVSGVFDPSDLQALMADRDIFTISGNASGICEGQSFSCALDNVSLDDEADFENSCGI